MKSIKCRFCENPLNHTFVDLGMAPLSNSYLKSGDLMRMESFYPLKAYVCERCFLVQLPEFQTREEIFSDYAYFSSYSDTWLKHAKNYVEKMIETFKFDKNSYVVEIASNDGYLLKNFVEEGVPVLGIEPAANVAEVARKKGIPTLVEFFGVETAKRLAKEGKYADLIVGNNVLAHVPNLNDFVSGMKILLKEGGVITMEFPHLMRLMDNTQFDTIYHEHFSYFSFITAGKVFSAHGLTIFDIEELPSHGGSLRIYARHKEDESRPVTRAVSELKECEEGAGYLDINHYLVFDEKVKAIKREILRFLVRAKDDNKAIAAYGAPAKGNTLLNYCGIRSDFIDYTVDRSPHKQGRYLPGSHIPVEAPQRIMETKPDYLFILPWNLKEEIMEQMVDIRQWGGKFVIPIPHVLTV